jgi:hypothetical protein
VIDTDDAQTVVDQAVAAQVAQCRHQQALDQIAGGAEQEQRRRRRDRRGLQIRLGLPFLRRGLALRRAVPGSSHYCGISTWPPKPKRIADSSLSA